MTTQTANAIQTLACLPVANPMIACRAMYRGVEVNVISYKPRENVIELALIQTVDKDETFIISNWKTTIAWVPADQVQIMRPDYEA